MNNYLEGLRGGSGTDSEQASMMRLCQVLSSESKLLGIEVETTERMYRMALGSGVEERDELPLQLEWAGWMCLFFRVGRFRGVSQR